MLTNRRMGKQEHLQHIYDIAIKKRSQSELPTKLNELNDVNGWKKVRNMSYLCPPT